MVRRHPHGTTSSRPDLRLLNPPRGAGAQLSPALRTILSYEIWALGSSVWPGAVVESHRVAEPSILCKLLIFVWLKNCFRSPSQAGIGERTSMTGRGDSDRFSVPTPLAAGKKSVCHGPLSTGDLLASELGPGSDARASSARRKESLPKPRLDKGLPAGLRQNHP